MTSQSQQSKSQATQSSGKSKATQPSASERGQFVSWLAVHGMNPSKATQLIRNGMTRQEISVALIGELQGQ